MSLERENFKAPLSSSICIDDSSNNCGIITLPGNSSGLQPQTMRDAEHHPSPLQTDYHCGVDDCLHQS